MRIDVMVDLETLGTDSDSSIFQIGAIAFDIKTGEIIKMFNHTADISLYKNPKIEGRTLKWWLETDSTLLRDIIVNGQGDEETMFSDFYEWLVSLTTDHMKDIYLWGNGILFDNRLLHDQMNKVVRYPIFYRNDRDVRTIVDLASQRLGISEKQLKEDFDNNLDLKLVKHNALDDCYYQVLLVHHCYNILVNGSDK